jgi:integrase
VGLYRPTVTRRRKDGTRSRTKTRVWWGSFTHPATLKLARVSLGTTDRQAAEVALSLAIRRAHEESAGLVNPFEEHLSRPLVDHVSDWRASLIAKGVTLKHVRSTVTSAKATLDDVKAKLVPDISASAVQASIGDLRTSGRSLRTCQQRLQAIKQFTRWLKRDGRARDDVLSHLSGVNIQTDRRRERRPLSVDELRFLIDMTATAPTWRRVTGADRAMLYRLATGTGFRASELRSLKVSSFNLDDDPPSVVLLAAHSKRRRDDVQPIRDDLAALLRPWIAGKSANTLAFPMMPEKTAKMLRQDLRRARARWIREATDRDERRERLRSEFLAVVDSAGRVVDFHALRATFITMLVRSGASVKEAQELARHSDPKLTMNIYTRLGVHDLAGALKGLPDQGSKPPERERLRATGTDHATPDEVCCTSVALTTPDGPCRRVAEYVGIDPRKRRTSPFFKTPNPLSNQAVTGGVCQRVTPPDETEPCRARTYDPLIKSQLLYQLS